MKTEDLGARAPLTRKTREYRALLALSDATAYSGRVSDALENARKYVESLGAVDDRIVGIFADFLDAQKLEIAEGAALMAALDAALVAALKKKAEIA